MSDRIHRRINLVSFCVPALAVAAGLSACGGTQSSSTASAPAHALQLQVAAPSATVQFDSLAAVPTFHTAPVILAEPGDVDRFDPHASAHLQPHAQSVPVELSLLSTRRLTWQMLDDARRNGGQEPEQSTGGPRPSPLASGSVVATYTPSQIRAAYGLPALPAGGVTPTSLQAAQLGAGQTIYLVDAKHDPNAAAELATFNQKFGLPGCTTVAIASTTALPLAAAPAAGCTFSVVYSTTSGGMTATAPAYDSGWATEIALDVQWSHATAPYARIVLIEAPDATLPNLIGAVQLANAMGPGAVSMSFGAPEGSWTNSVESNFTVAGMTYLAAAGDSGAGVQWPAVSPHVVAVGGTSLNYTGAAPRTEVAWSGTGGGVSQYTATPSWQNSAVPGVGSPGHRAVTDVSFNADPSTGQYVDVISPSTASVNWLSAGGTSLSTPQWAGVVAIANALRAQKALPLLAAPQAVLYGQIGTAPSLYAAAFVDVTQGADGSCATCAAQLGYDLPTGLGTPNVTSLLATLTGASAPTAAAVAPVVTAASVSGTVGTALSFAVAVSAPHPVSYTLSGAPAGMSIASTGQLSWAAPVLGTYAVTVTALDSQTGLTGSAVLSVKISGPTAPMVGSATVQGVANLALTFTPSVTNANPVTWSLSGAPAGMAVSAAGVVSWSQPVVGTYSVTVKALDAKTALSGQGTYTVVIASPPPPVVGSASVSGTVGKALSFTASATDANPLTFALSGAPGGMTISASGVVTWPTPVAGKYLVTVKATDAKSGLTGQGVYTVTVVVAGPVITAAPLTGVVGKALTGTIAFSDSTSTTLSVSISGVPSGMALAVSGATVTLSWAQPVAGSYALTVSAKDGNGLTATAKIPLTIAAH